MRVTEFYSEKHKERADRALKKAYFIEYVSAQMTLEADLEKEKKRVESVKKKKVTIKDSKS